MAAAVAFNCIASVCSLANSMVRRVVVFLVKLTSLPGAIRLFQISIHRTGILQVSKSNRLKRKPTLAIAYSYRRSQGLPNARGRSVVGLLGGGSSASKVDLLNTS